jgi:hypothetical protein
MEPLRGSVDQWMQIPISLTRSRIRIRIHREKQDTIRIRIRTKVMRIRNPAYDTYFKKACQAFICVKYNHLSSALQADTELVQPLLSEKMKDPRTKGKNNNKIRQVRRDRISE